ncbi:MAG: iron-sulfur cluster insertion protein ErpA [Bacillota bacterium]
MNVTLSESAAGRLRELISSKPEPIIGLRLLVRSGGCSGYSYGMALERQTRPDDLVVEHQGLKIVIDPGSAEFLDGAAIDYQESLMGGGFTIQNPNATSTCGCGSSFRTGQKAGSPSSCGH